jgi:hypothetical protein
VERLEYCAVVPDVFEVAQNTFFKKNIVLRVFVYNNYYMLRRVPEIYFV